MSIWIWVWCFSHWSPKLGLRGQVAWEELSGPPNKVSSIELFIDVYLCVCYSPTVPSRGLGYRQTVASLLYHPISAYRWSLAHVWTARANRFRLYSRCQRGGRHAGRTQRCRCPLTWCWWQTEGRWVDPWWFGWLLACMGRASLRAGRRYSRTRPSRYPRVACGRENKGQSVGQNPNVLYLKI